MTQLLFWLYIVNLTLLILHEMDSAYWKEWQLFHLPGGVGGFLLIHLPQMSGIDCVRQLKDALPDTRIVMLTVFASAQTKFRGLPEVYMGVHLLRLLGELGAMVAQVQALPGAMFEPGPQAIQ